MSNILTCDQCQKQYKIDARLAGRKVKCKACGHVMVIPAVEMPAPAVAAAQPAVAAARPASRPARSPAPIARPAARAGGEFRSNEPYASAHLALLDQWMTRLLFFVGLAAVNYPWLYYLYSCLSLPPLPPGMWKTVTVQALVYVLCTGLMMGAWLVIFGAVNQAGKALKFGLPEQPFKRLVALCAVPLLAWGVTYHYSFKSGAEAVFHPQAVRFTPPAPYVPPAPGTFPPPQPQPINRPMISVDEQLAGITIGSALKASGLAVVLAAGTFFAFYRLKKLDYALCAGVTCVLLGGTLVGETFMVRVLNKQIVEPVRKSVNDDLKKLSIEDGEAYSAKLQAYLKTHPEIFQNTFKSSLEVDAELWQLP